MVATKKHATYLRYRFGGVMGRCSCGIATVWQKTVASAVHELHKAHGLYYGEQGLLETKTEKVLPIEGQQSIDDVL